MRRSLLRVVRWGPLAIAGLAALAMWTLVDVWWPMVPLGYGPRWPWLLLIPLPLVSGGSRRARLLATSATALLVLWALVGFRLPSLPVSTEVSPPLRVVTFNAALKVDAVKTTLADAAAWGADIISVVECPYAAKSLPSPPGYQNDDLGEICLWTRTDAPPEIRTAPRDHDRIGWSGTIALATLPVLRPMRVGIVHLRSVRDELSEFLDVSEVASQAATMTRRHAKRLDGSRFAGEWFAAMDTPPDLILGDFNLVVESSRFRADWGRWHDAWEAQGLGPGYTWHSRWFGLRIDRVLHSDDWRTVRIRVGRNTGSDHQPVFVELIRPGAL